LAGGSACPTKPQTAEPLTKKLGIKPEIVPAADVDGLIARLGARKGGGAALVVGHSNTVPEIVKRLGGGTVAPIADTEYDRLFVATLYGPGRRGDAAVPRMRAVA